MTLLRIAGFRERCGLKVVFPSAYILNCIGRAGEGKGRVVGIFFRDGKCSVETQNGQD